MNEEAIAAGIDVIHEEAIAAVMDAIRQAEDELCDIRTENRAAQESITRAMRDTFAARMALIEAIRSYTNGI